MSDECGRTRHLMMIPCREAGPLHRPSPAFKPGGAHHHAAGAPIMSGRIVRPQAKLLIYQNTTVLITDVDPSQHFGVLSDVRLPYLGAAVAELQIRPRCWVRFGRAWKEKRPAGNDPAGLEFSRSEERRVGQEDA